MPAAPGSDDRAAAPLRPTLSAVLIAHDAAHLLERTLGSVAWADEIVVVDSGSTDGTRELAASLGARVVLQTEWRGFGAQKNFALAQARGDWILLLDADEVVDAELAAAIPRACRAPDGIAGYELRRVNRAFGVRLRYGGSRPAWLPRLFRRGRGRVTHETVHERVIVDGPVARLAGTLDHYTTESIAERVRKNDEYTSIVARARFRSGRRVGFARLAVVVPAVLFRDLLLRLGLLHGTVGIVVAVNRAFYEFAKYAKLWELQQQAASGSAISGREPTTPPAARSARRGPYELDP